MKYKPTKWNFSKLKIKFFKIWSPLHVSNTLFYLQDCLYHCMFNFPYRNCIYDRLPEDELSVSNHVEDIKNYKN